MSAFLDGFTDELTKTAALGSIVGAVARHPLRTLTMGIPFYAGYAGFKKGRAGGQRPRYLAASRHGPSKAALINWSKRLGLGKVPKKQVAALSRHHKPERFRS